MIDIKKFLILYKKNDRILLQTIDEYNQTDQLNKQDLIKLVKLFVKLNPRYKQILIDKYYNKKSYQKIAGNKSRQSIDNIINHILEKLDKMQLKTIPANNPRTELTQDTRKLTS